MNFVVCCLTHAEYVRIDFFFAVVMAVQEGPAP